MMFCKKKSSVSIWSIIGLTVTVIGVAAAIFALYKCLKKHLGCFCGKHGSCSCHTPEDLLSDLELDTDTHDCQDTPCTCPVREENDMASGENAVVNSENRMLNIENQK